MRTTLYLAGNYRQYVQYCQEKGIYAQPNVYINSPENIFGHLNVNVIYIGTWYERPDIDEIAVILQERNKLKMVIWCMKCQKKQSIIKPYFVKTRYNKYLVKGICPVCNKKMSCLITRAHYESEKQ